MLKQFFEASSESMKLYFKQVTSQLDHHGEKGSAREEKIKELLEKYLPRKYSITNGTVTNAIDNQSRQLDIIIHDNLYAPILEDFQSSKVIPTESLYGVIEVKSSLSKRELSKSVENIKSVKELNLTQQLPKVGCVFAYTSESSLETIRNNIEDLSKELNSSLKINCICILDKGLIVPLKKENIMQISLSSTDDIIYGIIENPSDALLLFYIHLLTLLNSTVISIPNLINYAESGGLIQKEIKLPTEVIPDDAKIDMGTHVTEYKYIRRLQEEVQPRIEVFQSGKMEVEELLSYSLEGYYLSTHGFALNSEYTFLDTIKRTPEEMREYYHIYSKNEKEVTEIEKLNSFASEIYKCYKEKM